MAPGELDEVWRVLGEQVQLGIVIYQLRAPDDDESLVMVGANGAAAAFAGFDVRARLGQTMAQAFPGSTPARRRLYADVVRTGRAQSFEVDYQHLGVPRHTFAVQAIPLPHQCVAAVFENLSAQKDQARQIRRLNTFLDAIIDNMPAMVFVKDAAHLRFELFNRTGEQLLGLSRESMLGKTDYDFFPKDQADFFVAKDREVLASGRLLDIGEEPIDTATGLRWLHTKKIPLIGDDGSPQHLLGISLDITDKHDAEDALRKTRDTLEVRVRERTADLERQIDERVRAEEALRNTEAQLRHAQKMEAIGRLAGGIAHDFNNLLSVILSYADIALGELRPDEPLREDLSEIRHAGQRAAELTRQLLAFSHQQVFNPRVLDLNQTVTGVEKMLRRLLGADIELICLTAATWRVRADPGQLEQVLLNLATNARDAMPGGGKLTLQTKDVEFDEPYAREHHGVTPGPHVMLAVSDTGVGMERDTQAKIFEPFFTTKEKGKGTGLGLSTVYGIVRQSGGHVWVYSEPGKGTTFRIYLPRTTDVEDSHANGQVQPDSGRGNETILLVEDDEQVRGVARGILRRNGYVVLEAASAGEALLISEQHAAKIHLLLTDVVMPRMGGPQLAERLRARRPELKVLFMSGYTGEAIAHHGILESNVPFLQKPITPDALTRKVREALVARENGSLPA
ncbi:MAG: PAS domain-containing protein [Deltaproteobacteria bacterium]|nr:PAS domain-containing protein [Deltaproteobacteria bacterium]